MRLVLFHLRTRVDEVMFRGCIEKNTTNKGEDCWARVFRLFPHPMHKNPKNAKKADLSVGEHCGIVALEHPLDQWEDAVGEEGGQVAPSASIHVVIRERAVGPGEVHLEGPRGGISD